MIRDDPVARLEAEDGRLSESVSPTDRATIAPACSSRPGSHRARCRPNWAASSTRTGSMVIDEDGRTSVPGIFAAGDATVGKAAVVLAAAAGSRAAYAINAELARGTLPATPVQLSSGRIARPAAARSASSAASRASSRAAEDLEPDDLAVLDRPEVADADLDLDAADSAAGALPHGDGDVVAVLVEVLGLDRELVKDLELEPRSRAGSRRSRGGCPPSRPLLGLEPFEVVVEQGEARLVVAVVDRLVEGPDESSPGDPRWSRRLAFMEPRGR